MSSKTNPAPPQVEKRERYCTACNSQVTPDAETCPSCKKVLFVDGWSPWSAGLIGYLWGFLLGILTCAIFATIGKFAGIGDSKAFYGFALITSGLVFFGAQSSKKAKLIARRDLSVWRKS